MGKLYVGAVGVKLIVDTGVDLSGATYVSLKVKKPDGSETEWIGSALGTKIEYIIQQGDLDQSGFYKIQAYVEFSDGSKMYGETDGMYVYKNFD